jgi:hypothetical protein
MKRKENAQAQLDHAHEVARQYGQFRAARFLANRGWSIEAALYTLAGPAALRRPSTPRACAFHRR